MKDLISICNTVGTYMTSNPVVVNDVFKIMISVIVGSGAFKDSFVR